MARKNPLGTLAAGDVDRLRAAQQVGPYRFWGSQKPPESRDPIRAQVVTSGDGAGTAQIRIYDPIDSWGGIWGISAKEFAEALDALPGPVSTIELHINSPGGEAWEAIAILNLLRQHPASTRAVVDSLAASAASFLAAGMDETIMAPQSQLMIHDAWGLAVGNAGDLREYADLLDKVSNVCAAVYQAKGGHDVAYWRALMLEETWMDDQEAVDYGLADSVLGTAPETAPAQAAFDLSVFRHAGRAEAPAPPAPDDPFGCGGHDVPGAAHKDECLAATARAATARRAAARARHLRLNERRTA